MTQRIRGIAVAAVYLVAAMAVPGTSRAVALNLTQTYPDLFTSSASLMNTWTPQQCFKSNGGSVSCTNPQVDPSKTIAAHGVFTMTGSAMTLNPDGSGSILVSSGPNGLSYNLTANFDSNGVYTGGTLLAQGTTANPGFQSGTIVKANLTNFGFAGSGTAGIFEFQFNDPAMTGDFAAFYGNYSGVIASTFNLSGWSGNWDPSSNNNPAFWQRNFSASGNVDTFVPIPGAAWLFGSGCLLLAGMMRRRRTAA